MRQNYANTMIGIFFRTVGMAQTMPAVRWVIVIPLCVWLYGLPAFALPFTVRLDDLKPGIIVPVKVRDEVIAPNFPQIERRVQVAELDSRVEPLYISVPKDDDERAAFALQLARPKKYRQLMAKLDQAMANHEVNVSNAGGSPALPSLQSTVTGNQNNSVNPVAGEDRVKHLKIRVRPELLALMAPAAVTSKLQRLHLQVKIDSSELLELPDVKSELLVQLAPFFGGLELRKVA